MTALKVLKEKKRGKGRPIGSCNKIVEKHSFEQKEDDDELTKCLLNLPHMTIDLDLIARKVEEQQREQVEFENSLDDNKKIDEIYFIVSLIMKENMELKQENISNRVKLENYRSHYNHITSNCYIIEKDKCPYLGSALEFERMLSLSPDELNN
jgi:hypothetical protein